MKSSILLLALSLLVVGCATSNHASFTAASHMDRQNSRHQSLGTVSGESRQTWLLYLFPHGDAPSTREAIHDAKSKIPGTRYLSDIAIDDRIYWGIGYYEQVIKVEADARN